MSYVKAKKLDKKEQERLAKKCSLICAEVERLRESVERGAEFSYSGYSCDGDNEATASGIKRQVITLRTDLLSLSKEIGRVNPW